ncbi:MAG: hypothetical protein GX547_14050 [Phycisphaerae bacterium]|nr:hypothetical protein [Phycisphaerae bacterium]
MPPRKLSYKDPPRPVHVSGTNKGEELVQQKGREPGRNEPGIRPYRTARDSTGLNAASHAPIDARMPEIPPA